LSVRNAPKLSSTMPDCGHSTSQRMSNNPPRAACRNRSIASASAIAWSRAE
jgi:hypothetical protein